MRGANGGTNGPPIPTVPGGVPIIGQAVYMACSQGHVERLAGAFTITIPGAGADAITLMICRVCVAQFVRMFGARPLTASEIEELRATGQIDNGKPV